MPDQTNNVTFDDAPVMLVETETHPVWPRRFIRVHMEKGLLYLAILNRELQLYVLVCRYLTSDTVCYIFPLCIRSFEKFIKILHHQVFQPSFPVNVPAFSVQQRIYLVTLPSRFCRCMKKLVVFIAFPKTQLF